MRMYEYFLNSIPSYRYDMVNDLEIPNYIASPYIWMEPDCWLSRRDSLLTSLDECAYELRTLTSTDSSIPLSRAVTDSDIDYDRYRRLKNLRYSDPWENLRACVDNFPPGYISNLRRFQVDSTITERVLNRERRRHYNEALILEMERFFDEECRVFGPDDPGLLTLQDALLALDTRNLDSDLYSIF